MHAALAAPCDPTPLLLAPIGAKPLNSTVMGADCLPMPVSSCSKISMTTGLTRALATALSMRAMRVASALLQTIYSNNGSFKLPLAMKMRTTPTLYATILSSNSCWIGSRDRCPLGLTANDIAL